MKARGGWKLESETTPGLIEIPDHIAWETVASFFA